MTSPAPPGDRRAGLGPRQDHHRHRPDGGAGRAPGSTVSGHKVGPDYIDPGYHALATGRPGRNLDPHLVGEERLVPLLLHGAAGADLAVIEGVMGLYDGQLGTDGFASTAHVAAVTSTPGRPGRRHLARVPLDRRDRARA